MDGHPEMRAVALDAEQEVVPAKSGLELKYDQCLISDWRCGVMSLSYRGPLIKNILLGVERA